MTCNTYVESYGVTTTCRT